MGCHQLGQYIREHGVHRISMSKLGTQLKMLSLWALFVFIILFKFLLSNPCLLYSVSVIWHWAPLWCPIQHIVLVDLPKMMVFHSPYFSDNELIIADLLVELHISVKFDVMMCILRLGFWTLCVSSKLVLGNIILCDCMGERTSTCCWTGHGWGALQCINPKGWIGAH